MAQSQGLFLEFCYCFIYKGKFSDLFSVANDNHNSVFMYRCSINSKDPSMLFFFVFFFN